MRCLTRYVLIEFTKVFAVGLAAMTVLMVLAVIGHEMIRYGLGPESVTRLVPYTLPIALLYAIPATTLFAACSVYGRLAADNEVTAVQSLGINPMALVTPVLGLAFLLSLVVVAMNDLAVTLGRNGVKRVVLQSVEQIAYGMLRTQRSYSGPRFSINVMAVDGRTLMGPTFTFYAQDESVPIIFTAEQAELTADLGNSALRIRLTNWEVEQGNAWRVVVPGTEEFYIPLEDAAHKVGAGGRPADLALRNIPAAVKVELAEIARLEQTHAAEAAYQIATGDFDRLLSSSWQRRRDARRAARSRLHRLYTEPWRRWANGFSCLAFVLVGAPVALRLRNSDVWTSFGVCFLPILAGYYPLLAYGVGQAKSGSLPPYCVWLGNAVFMLLGVAIIRRVLRF